jgi:2-haloacid dehalogenase
VIVFDVNETLLDLSPLDQSFEETFGDASLRSQWFSQMLQVAFTGAITDEYVDFSAAQRAALRMLAAAKGVALEDAQVEAVAGQIRSLPAYPEVADALDRLREAGHRLAALTNSPLDVAREQLANAGIADRFDAIVSADEVRALKPRREAYELVAERCGVAIGDVCLVAAHAWDVSGALAAGCSAAFVCRPGKVPSPIGTQPQIVGTDLHAVADGILRDPALSRTPAAGSRRRRPA